MPMRACHVRSQPDYVLDTEAEDCQCRRPGPQGLSSCPGHHERHAADPPLSGEWLVHTQVPSICHLHHLSGTERLSQGPKPQDHQPQCQLCRPVQEPHGHVPDLPLGQASVLWRQWHPDSCLSEHNSHACPQLHGADFNQTMPEKFRLHNTLFLDEDFPEALAYRPASWAWGGGEVSHGEDNKRAPFIHQHAVTMATATCAAEVHQHSSCHQQ